MRGSEAVRIPGVETGMGELSLEIPPDAEQVRTARLFAAAAARHFGIDEDRVEDLKVAISEACTNAIGSHQKAGVSDPVRVVATPDDGGIRFDVTDAGPGFDPELVLAADRDYTPPSGLTGGSLGLALIRALFSTIEITRNAGRGMTVSILVEPASPAA